MLITYPRDTMLAVVSYMQRTGALGKKESMPVLGFVRLDSGRITATNLDWSLTYAVEIDAHTDFLLPAAQLIELLKRADARSAITFEFNDDLPPTKITAVFKIRDRITSFDMLSIPPEDFPPHPAVEWPPTPQVWGPDELAAITHALECSSTDPTRFVLNSVFADLSASPRGCFVSTDARRIFVSATQAWMWLPCLTEEDTGFIMPKEPMATVTGDLKKWPWRVRRTARFFQAEAGPWTLFTKLVDANFPPYRHVIPQAPRSVGWRLSPDEAAEAAVLIRSLIYSEQVESVRLHLTAAGARAVGPVGNMQIALPGTVEIPAIYPEAWVNLNREYLCTALNHAPVLITLASDSDPIICHFADGGLEVVMPTRLDNGTSSPVATDAAVVQARATPPASAATDQPEAASGSTSEA